MMTTQMIDGDGLIWGETGKRRGKRMEDDRKGMFSPDKLGDLFRGW